MNDDGVTLVPLDPGSYPITAVPLSLTPSNSTEGKSVPNTSLVNLVMRFPDAGAAAAAAAALVATDRTQRPTPIPRHLDAAASAFDMAQGVVVESFTPHGPLRSLSVGTDQQACTDSDRTDHENP